MIKAKNILCVGDCHLPFVKRGYLDFCRRVQEKYDCETVVNIGDEVDHHALSRHTHNPNGLSPGDEYKAAYREMQKWFRAFPECFVCIGNHSARSFRLAEEHGIPNTYLKSYQEIWNAPDTWRWAKCWEINNILFMHGTGKSGLYAHANWAKQNRQSTVVGHLHANAGVEWFASRKDIIFGMAVGSGVDVNSYAAAYGDDFSSKPIISCGVILNNGKEPLVLKMEM